jgi:hypothetical protein
MHRPERRIAIRHALDIDAESHDVVDLLELALLLLHLAIDGVEVLGAPAGFGRKALLGEPRSNGAAHTLDVVLAFLLSFCQLGRKLAVRVGLQVSEG